MNQKPCDCPHCLKQADVHLRKHVNLNEPSEHCYECRADSPKPESEIVTVPSLPHEPVVTTTNKTDGVGGSEPESATTEPNEASTN